MTSIMILKQSGTGVRMHSPWFFGGLQFDPDFTIAFRHGVELPAATLVSSFSAPRHEPDRKNPG
ncbi:MAG: hypothetical protein HQK55_10625 [Deltaproteobacteria bacterium]|nr:hypothetical protein [Deltaproteobacteria bacterium]